MRALVTGSTRLFRNNLVRTLLDAGTPHVASAKSRLTQFGGSGRSLWCARPFIVFWHSLPTVVQYEERR